jgi:predicted nucleic acid-binding Zn ribbon protein
MSPLKRLPPECETHLDRDYVNLMAVIAMREVTCIDDAVEVMEDLREHERNAMLMGLKRTILQEIKDAKTTTSTTD